MYLKLSSSDRFAELLFFCGLRRMRTELIVIILLKNYKYIFQSWIKAFFRQESFESVHTFTSRQRCIVRVIELCLVTKEQKESANWTNPCAHTDPNGQECSKQLSNVAFIGKVTEPQNWQVGLPVQYRPVSNWLVRVNGSQQKRSPLQSA